MSLFWELADPWSSWSGIPSNIPWTPRIDAVQTATHLIITAELPGVKKDDISVTLQEGVLTISGNKPAKKMQDGEKRLFQERSYGQFRRALRLAPKFNQITEPITARFDAGVLEISIPIPHDAIPQKIKIEETTAKARL